jgi:hypothetical protein
MTDVPGLTKRYRHATCSNTAILVDDKEITGPHNAAENSDEQEERAFLEASEKHSIRNLEGQEDLGNPAREVEHIKYKEY